MSKLDKMKNYLKQVIEINFDYIDEIKQMPQSQIDFMGGVAEWYATTGCSSYYTEVVNAIKFAGWSPVNKIDNLNRDFFVLCHD